MMEAVESTDAESPPAAYTGADDVTYRRDAVPVGPFREMPPLDLLRLLSANGVRPGSTVRARGREWLACALEEAGVVLGDYDRDVVALLADDCATTVQVVAGWIAQARDPHAERTAR